ncbi:MAG: C40 family peptidase [Bacteroidetes bacterium]|nr:C40 family peptidase [Bacteroidota bacterium]
MENYGCCTLSVVPVRSTPGHRGEMVNQLLFGDFFTILEKDNQWLRIRTLYDEYEGWLSEKQYTRVTNHSFVTDYIENQFYFTDLLSWVREDSCGKKRTPVVFGSVVRNVQEDRFELNGKRYCLEGMIKPVSLVPDREELIRTAMLFKGAPYLWGGRSFFGIDCSGLVQIVFKVNGIGLPRDAGQQALTGKTIHFLNEVLPGDLAFFDNEEGRIVHVGILLGPDRILHASGQVRKDVIDHQGIFRRDCGEYSHRLRIIKRIF